MLTPDTDWHIPETKCPECGNAMDGSGANPAEKNPRPPVDGDPCVCFKCTALLAHTATLALRKATPEDIAHWKKQPGLMREIETLRSTIRLFWQAQGGGAQN